VRGWRAWQVTLPPPDYSTCNTVQSRNPCCLYALYALYLQARSNARLKEERARLEARPEALVSNISTVPCAPLHLQARIASRLKEEHARLEVGRRTPLHPSHLLHVCSLLSPLCRMLEVGRRTPSAPFTLIACVLIAVSVVSHACRRASLRG
jgi:hypothetical protein